MGSSTQGNWKETDINVDSLRLYGERDKTDKHLNLYHGNFIPQIPYIFMGSGTTLFECEKLNRRFIGFDINTEIISFVTSQMADSKMKYTVQNCDVTNNELFEKNIKSALSSIDTKSVQFIIVHPSYMDIVKFTDLKEDLSQINNVDDFISVFVKSMDNSLLFLDKVRYFGCGKYLEISCTQERLFYF
jgi:hypothetical protein